MRGDVAGAIIGDIILKKKNKLVCDPRCSLGVRKYFLNKGVKVLISRVGHFNIKKMMREKGAIMGIEITGHIYFRNLNFSEDPFFAIRKITEVLDKNPGKKISEIFKPFGSWCHSGTIDLKIKDANKAIAKLKTNYRAGAQSTLDGLTVEFPNHWWFNIRPSHTEPVVRLVVEANSEELLKEKIKEIKELINTK
jgi:phosphomannomutase